MKKTRLFTTAKFFTSLAMVLSLSSCDNAPSPVQKLTVSGPFEAVSFDPARAGYIFTRMEVMETLVDVAPDGQLIPGLATQWQRDDDNRVWTFELRQGVKFHNGQPMTADTVVNSLKRAFAKPAPFERSLVKSIEATGPHQVTITLVRGYRPFAAIMSNYATAIIAPNSFADNKEQQTSGFQTDVEQLIATGPYKVKQFEPPHSLLVEKFDNYWGQPARIERAQYITGHRSESRALMVQGGQADIVYNLDPASVKSLSKTDNVTVDTSFIPRSILIKLNAGIPGLDNLKVRQALSLAIDRTGIANKILRVPGIEANQIFGHSLGVWHNSALPPIAFNQSKARQLLDDAGWELKDDGLRYKDGKPLTLNMVTYANRPELMVIATAIQDQWKQIGINIAVQMRNVGSIPMGHMRGTLDTALIARNLGNIPDPLALLLSDFSSADGGEWGPMNWRNPTVFEALEVIKNVDSDEQYKALAEQIAAEIATDLPMIPIVFYVQQTAVSKRVKGFSFDPYERSFNISDMTFIPTQP